MDALGGGHGGLWGWHFPLSRSKGLHSKNQRNRPDSKSSDFAEVAGVSGYRFPLKQALTAGCLALTGDTIAQITAQWNKGKSFTDSSLSHSDPLTKDPWTLLSEHDWIRALRMASYGFLFYGPGSFSWYQFLDRSMPKKTVENLLLKVLLNQIILGPSVIAVVFAWNNLLQGKISQLPEKYRKDALPTLFYGFRFWIPVSVLNFWAVPLQARVAFMSMCSIFWNFFLSSTMSK